jgi:aspartate racemase
MEQPFLREHFAAQGIEAVPPCAADRERVHRVIFEELCRGIVSDGSRQAYLAVIERLAADGCSAVLLGCTEIGLLLPPDAPSAVPMFDSTVLHAEAAARWICEERLETTR